MKKKLSKRLVSLILAAICVFALTACGTSAAVGEYKLTKVKYSDTEMDVDSLSETSGITLDITCNLEKDGSFSLDLSPIYGTTVSGTWKMSGSNVELTAEDETITGTLSGDTLTLSENDEVLVFEK